MNKKPQVAEAEAAHAREQAEILAVLRDVLERYEGLSSRVVGGLPRDTYMAMEYTRVAFLNHVVRANSRLPIIFTLQ